ncbi:hypothetical protein ACSBR1_013593 [Camellia fascicularis]
MVAFPYFDLIINYEDKVDRIYDVDPNMYCYIDAVKDVTETVLSHIDCSEAITITLHCDMLGTENRRLIENDLHVLDMFYVQGRSKTINLYVDIAYCIGKEYGGDGNSGVHGVHTIEVDKEYHEDNVYGFSDEDKDWNASDDGEPVALDGNNGLFPLALVIFVHPYYSKQTYLIANGGIIHLILDHTVWTLILGDFLQPPPLKRLPERPRNAKNRAAHEPPAGTSQSKRSSTLRCKWCMQFGHNRRTCQRGPVRGRVSGSGRIGGRGNDTIADKGRGSVKGNSVGRGSSSGRGTSTRREKSTGRGRGKANAKHV